MISDWPELVFRFIRWTGVYWREQWWKYWKIAPTIHALHRRFLQVRREKIRRLEEMQRHPPEQPPDVG